MRSPDWRSQARHGARQRLCARRLSAPALVGSILPPSALAASADGSVDRTSVDYTVPERLAGTPVLAGRFDLDREAVCPAGGLGGSIPPCQAHCRAGQAPARPVLRLCGPLIPDGAAAVGQRPGRRLALCQRTVHPTVGGGPRPAVASARAGAAGVGGRSGHRQSSLSPVLGPPGSVYPGTRAFKSGLLLRAAPSTQAGPASELWTEVPGGPIGEAYAFAVAAPDHHPENTGEGAHRAGL